VVDYQSYGKSVTPSRLEAESQATSCVRVGRIRAAGEFCSIPWQGLSVILGMRLAPEGFTRQTSVPRCHIDTTYKFKK